MFREYAIEPAVISNWERARFFLDAFGPEKGRFLAELPKGWAGEVYRRLACAPVEKKRIEEKLVRFHKRNFSPRDYVAFDRTLAWLDNALAEHVRAAFSAIIAMETRSHPDVIDADLIDDSEPRWTMPTGMFVARNAAAIVATMRLLLASSKSVVWIDPYFRASSVARRVVFTDVCRVLPATTSVSIHVNLGRDEDPDFQTYSADLKADLAPHLPDGFEVRVHCWAQRDGGERLHNRFIVTDVGGIKFGDSIAQGTQSGEEDHLSILDEPSRLRLLASYDAPGNAFNRVGAVFVIRGTRPRR